MNETVLVPALLPVLPEIVLALGAMALLMVGVYSRRDRLDRVSNAGAIALLVLTGIIVLLLPSGKLVSFGGSFVVDGFARIMKILSLIGSAAAIVGVMPQAFQMPRGNVQIWTNLPVVPPTRRGPFFYRGIARLKLAVSLDQAQPLTGCLQNGSAQQGESFRARRHVDAEAQRA